MKTYTEQEVDDLLKSQRDNCWVALQYSTQDNTLLSSVINAPAPGGWRNKKQFFIVFGGIFTYDVSDIPVGDRIDWVEKMRDIALLPLEQTKGNPAKNIETKVEISKETAEFLKQNCNIERNNYGEDTYILNNLRFKIIEE